MTERARIDPTAPVEGAPAQQAARPGPEPFRVYWPGVLLHGTKADLPLGSLLIPGFPSNFDESHTANHVYFTETLDAAAWGAELAVGSGRPRIYIVTPMGEVEDDPNVTNRRFPGNPTRSFRTREPLTVVGELLDWVGHTPEQIETMMANLASLAASGQMFIDD